MLCKVWGFHSGDHEEYFLCVTLVFLVFLRSVFRLLVTANVVPSSPILFHPDDGRDTFLREIGSYKSNTA
jgi:hypothetical protein